MRRAFAQSLVRLAGEDDRIIFLTGDLGFGTFDEFQQRFGPRYINVGVAEAQMMCAAAGLALEGWRPVVYSIASFATARALEQVRVCISYHTLPVVIIGAGGGYLYASSGVTHHAADDLGLMSLIPAMTVVAPADPVEVTELLPHIFKLSGPAYIRIGKYGEPDLDAAEVPVLGRARRVRDGERILVLTTGDMAGIALSALNTLKEDSIFPLLFQMHTVKPLDTDTLDQLADQVKALVVVEEHIPVGGLWSAICSWYALRSRHGLQLLRIGAPDAHVFGSPEREELQRRIHCDAGSIAQALRRLWSEIF
jgi:transketolase